MGRLGQQLFLAVAILFRQHVSVNRSIVAVLTFCLLGFGMVYENYFTSNVIVPEVEEPFESVVDLIRAGYSVEVELHDAEFKQRGSLGLSKYKEDIFIAIFTKNGELNLFDRNKFVVGIEKARYKEIPSNFKS